MQTSFVASRSSKIKGPCLNCPDRCPIPNCHMTCQAYLDYKTALSELDKIIREEKYGTTLQFIPDHIRKRYLK